MLKLKATIYYHTGIYLAHREEKEYLKSPEFWKSFAKMAGNKKNDMSANNCQKLLVGLWQARNGFSRPRSIWWRLKCLIKKNSN